MVIFYNKKLKNHMLTFKIDGKGLNIQAFCSVFALEKPNSGLASVF
jgi:hypothetical protein